MYGIGRGNVQCLRRYSSKLKVQSLVIKQGKLAQGSISGGKGPVMASTYSFDNSCANSSNGPFNLFIARRTHNKRAARVNGRQESVTVLQAMLEVPAQGHGLIHDPLQFAFL